MSTVVFFAVLAFILQMRNSWEQRKRLLHLGHYLRNFEIEKLMESLTEGYLRALGEDDAERRTQIWNMLEQTEQNLNGQFQKFVEAFAQADVQASRGSTLALGLPFALVFAPGATFDMRQLLRVHAQGIEATLNNTEGLSNRDKAFRLSAELFLMQHSCHWFCKSKLVASARMLSRHKTHYAQLLSAVRPQTREAYSRLMRV
jgi:hypothetical protein